MLKTYLLLLDSEEDNTRFTDIFNQNKDILGNYAYSILRDKQLSEDAVSDAFFKLAKVFYRIRDKSDIQIRNYLMVITRNAALKIYGKRRNEIPVEHFDNFVAEKYEIEDELDEKFIRDEAFRYIRNMDPKYGDVLLLKYQFGLQDKEIANSLGITLNNAKIRLFRGKRKLQDMMKEGQYDRQSI